MGVKGRQYTQFKAFITADPGPEQLLEKRQPDLYSEADISI